MSVKIQEFVQTHWKLIVAYGALFAVLAGALLWQLNTLVPGYSPLEVQAYNSSLSFRAILDNPINAPYHVAVRALMVLHPDSYIVTRLVSVTAGLIVLVIFAALLRHWHDDRTAIAGTLLFGLSAWFLHVARMGTPGVLFFGVFVVVACGFWLKHTSSWLALFACFLSVAALLYVPGMLWFVAIGIAWQWKHIDRIFKRHLAAVTGASLAFLAALAPLIWGLYKHHELIRPFLALPTEWPNVIQIAKNIFLVPFHLFVHNASSPATWLGTAPILDVFSLTMLVLGSWLYLRHWRLARTPIFILILLVSAGLMAIGSPITYSVVIPFLYIIIAAGMMYMLSMWFSVFPRNPIARNLGWTLIGIVVVLALSYHITHYFVGWPQAQATHNIFTAQKP